MNLEFQTELQNTIQAWEKDIKNKLFRLTKTKNLPSPDPQWKCTEGYSQDKRYDFFLVFFLNFAIPFNYKEEVIIEKI